MVVYFNVSLTNCNYKERQTIINYTRDVNA